jgi:hypothetical protein
VADQNRAIICPVLATDVKDTAHVGADADVHVDGRVVSREPRRHHPVPALDEVRAEVPPGEQRIRKSVDEHSQWPRRVLDASERDGLRSGHLASVLHTDHET